MGRNFLIFCVLAGAIGLGTGLFEWQPTRDGVWKTALIAFFVPALLEEIVFRGPLLLRRVPLILGIGWAVGGFTLWHVLEARTFLPDGAFWFLRTDFLAIAALFGLMAALTVRQTGALWPVVVMHWMIVIVWKQILGGPTLVGS